MCGVDILYFLGIIYNNMVLYFLIAISLGIEGGYNFPATGFDNLNSGAVLNIFINRNFGFADIAVSLETDFYRGKNSSYALNRYGIEFQFSKNNWRFSPIFEIGSNYIYRKLNKTKETGYALSYGLGILLNFHIDRLRLYPKFYYDGTTDLKSHAGFIGVKMGINYEF